MGKWGPLPWALAFRNSFSGFFSGPDPPVGKKPVERGLATPSPYLLDHSHSVWYPGSL